LSSVARTKRREVRKEVYSVTLKAFREDKIYFGKTGKNWDRTRKQIDTIVIHSNEPEYFKQIAMASVVPLIRIYVPLYANATADKEYYRKPLWSNHFDEYGKMNFWTYHWLINKDGTIQRLLKDEQIGWHAGNFIINQRSIAICVPVNFKQETPSATIISSVVSIIQKFYSFIPKENIIGHCEVSRNPKYKNEIYCPGKTFLKEWKRRIIDQLS